MGNNTQRVQGRVADELLQRPHVITVNGVEYEVARPTLGTLVLVSQELADFPDFKLGDKFDVKNILRSARYAGCIARVLATLIVGAKNIDDKILVPDVHAAKKRVFLRNRRIPNVELRRVDYIAKEILENMSVEELSDRIVELLNGLQLTDFFAITTFLQGVNLTKPTKVETQTGRTASGQS